MRKLLVLGILFISTMGFAGSARAFDTSSGDQTSLASDKTVSGSYYAAGNTVDINGSVKGDVFCAGQNVTINGPVQGDVLCAAQNITINGPVSGNVRLAAQTVNLNGSIGRNASILAQTLVTSKDSVISGELMAQTAGAALNGTVTGETYGNASRLSINGSTGKVRFAAENVTIGSSALINGNLEYTSSNGADIQNGGRISGDTKRTTPKVPAGQRPNAASAFLSGLLFSILSTLLMGALLLWLAPRFVAGASAHAGRPGFTLLLGFAALILTPIAAVMIMFTVIGLPAGVLGLTVWAVALYLSRIITALAVGTVIYRRLYKSGRTFRPYAAGAMGILVCFVIFAVPIVGGFASFLASLYGLGVLVHALRNHIDREDTSSRAKLVAE